MKLSRFSFEIEDRRIPVFCPVGSIRKPVIRFKSLRSLIDPSEIVITLQAEEVE